MSVFDIFKKKELEKKAEKKEKKAPKVKVEKKEEVIKPAVSKKKVIGASYGILNFPHVTEKATDLSEKNKYVFRVNKGANKNEIKKAVENNYGVNIASVRIINIKSKKRRVGKHMGVKKGYKKAIVEVVKGQKIEILPR